MLGEPSGGGLFAGIFAAGPVHAQLDDVAWLQAMLDVEAALAGAQADVGLIERAHADEIALACRAELYDPSEIGARATGSGNPAAPLVRALTDRVGGAASGHVHVGATSQDVIDSAAMLVTSRALAVIAADVEACAQRVAGLAAQHINTVQVGRTLLQQALPVTFGLATAGWLSALDSTAVRVATLRSGLTAQLGGATGTLASFGAHGTAVLVAFSDRLGLTEPALPWHTERSRIAEIAGVLGQCAGTIASIAGNIVLLAQSEVGEVVEQGPPGSGGSSTMPHKRNPVAAVAARANAQQAPGLVSTLLSSMPQEHQRGAGSWHAEWRPLVELLRVAGSATHWLRSSVDRLEPDAERMKQNLDAGGGVLLAERVTTELAGRVGRLAAHDAVTECCRRALAGDDDLAELLAADSVVGTHLDRESIATLLDPAEYLGSAATFVERALRQHQQRKEQTS